MKRMMITAGLTAAALWLSGCAGMEISPIEQAMLDCGQIHSEYDAGCVERLSPQHMAEDAEDRARARSFLMMNHLARQPQRIDPRGC